MCIENLKKNLRYLRRKHGFGQPYIAEYCGKKSYTTIQKWEEGKAEPSFKDVYVLAELYGVNIDDFVKVDLELRDAQPVPIIRESLLPEEEKDLIKKYRCLNDKGKEHVEEQFEFCLSNEKYKAQPKTEEDAASSA